MSREFLWRMAWWIVMVCLVGCQPRPFDPYVLNEQAGQMEVVIPAEHRISAADVSPRGTWLYYDYRASDNKTYASLLNIPENKWYDKILENPGLAVWLDDDHLATAGVVWQLSTMTAVPKEKIRISTLEEGRQLLDGTANLFFVRQVAGDPIIISTDPSHSYMIQLQPRDFGCSYGTESDTNNAIECVKAMLTEEQIASLVDVPDNNASRINDGPIYSPDGQYYIAWGQYPDDPTHNLGGIGVQLFRTRERTPIVYGHRYGWVASFLGWAPDSSGAYILYRPRSATGDLLRSQYPIRKYLVPGAVPRGAPTLVDPLPVIEGLEVKQ